MKNNIIILGAGRSGTSMVAGTIAKTGEYNIGGEPHRPNIANPKGFFETSIVNGINNEILFSQPKLKTTTGNRQGWLSYFDGQEQIFNNFVPFDMLDKIKHVISKQPFVFKDPRFSFTLPFWNKIFQAEFDNGLFNNLKVICCFRHPAEFLGSLTHHCATQEYLKGIIIDQNHFENLWLKTYQYILTHYYDTYDTLFVEYDQVLSGNGIRKIEEFIGHEIIRDFPEKSLKRSKGILISEERQKDMMVMYGKLCSQAEYIG